MDRNALNDLYLTHKTNIHNKEWLTNTIEELYNILQSIESNKTSNFLYETLCEYFSVTDSDIILCNIIYEATISNKYKTLAELEQEINKIRKDE